MKLHSTFVENRGIEIRNEKDIGFFYEDTSQNPADIGTKGMIIQELCTIWNSGPSWLKNSVELWANIEKVKISREDMEKIRNETKGAQRIYEVSAPVSDGLCEEERIDTFLNRDFSSLTKLYRGTVYCRRFLDKVKKKNIDCGPILASELSHAKRDWEISVQKRAFSGIALESQRGGEGGLIRI